MARRPSRTGLPRVADIERRIEEARLADGGIEPYAVEDAWGWRFKAAELDALCEQGRVLPEGLEWPRWEDGGPVNVGDRVGYGVGAEIKVHCVQIYSSGWVLADCDGRHVAMAEKGERVNRPELPDSWERIEEDSRKNSNEYWKCVGIPCTSCPAKVGGKSAFELYGCKSCGTAMACDLVRRARALAEARDE